MFKQRDRLTCYIWEQLIWRSWLSVGRGDAAAQGTEVGKVDSLGGLKCRRAHRLHVLGGGSVYGHRRREAGGEEGQQEEAVLARRGRWDIPEDVWCGQWHI